MAHEMTEFKITSDLSAVKQQIISANFDEVKAWLQENLAPYVDMVVQEDDIPAAKTYRANIRKVRDRIDECRKEAKNAALAPYIDFENKSKVLTSLCDSAAGALDIQIKGFEEKEADAKIAALKAFYDESMMKQTPLVLDCLPWERVNNPKWRNKTFSADAAQKEIADAIEHTVTDIYAIGEMGARDPAYLLDYYKQTHDLAKVLAKATELEHIRNIEQTPQPTKSYADDGLDAVRYAEAAKEEAEKLGDAIRQMDFRVWASDSQLRELAAFLRAKGIKYGRIT